MDARRRLFALLVALFCAMGWAPTASARGSGDSVSSGESRGVLPGRPPESPPAEPTLEGVDDEPACLPPHVSALPEPNERLAPPARHVDPDRPATARWQPASPRGPPSIA